MPRLFIAIDLSDPIKAHLQTRRVDIPGAVWAKRHTFHLTLRFIGDQVPTTQIDAIVSALGGLRFEPFDLHVQGVGRFPPGSRGAARVLWAGIAAPPALTQLYTEMSAALAPLGFPPEDRPFHPHVTLARMKAPRPHPSVDRFLAQAAGLRSDVVRVNAFHLYESELLPQGPRYTRRASFMAQSTDLK